MGLAWIAELVDVRSAVLANVAKEWARSPVVSEGRPSREQALDLKRAERPASLKIGEECDDISGHSYAASILAWQPRDALEASSFHQVLASCRDVLVGKIDDYRRCTACGRQGLHS